MTSNNDTSNDSSTIRLTRRRALGGLMTVGIGAAGAGAGTFAYFSDTETSADNTVSAGTLDLKADSGDTEVTTVDISGVAPGGSGSQSTTLENSGTIDGSVDLNFGSADNLENATPESETETTSPGDLGGILEVTVSIGSTTVRSGTFNSVFDGTEDDSNVPLNAGISKDLYMDWELPTSDDTFDYNTIQGDSVTGDITIELNQTDGQ